MLPNKSSHRSRLCMARDPAEVQLAQHRSEKPASAFGPASIVASRLTDLVIGDRWGGPPAGRFYAPCESFRARIVQSHCQLRLRLRSHCCAFHSSLSMCDCSTQSCRSATGTDCISPAMASAAARAGRRTSRGSGRCADR